MNSLIADKTTADSLEKSLPVSHESYKNKLLEKLVLDEKAFDAASVEIARLHDKLFTAIAIGASKFIVKDVDVTEVIGDKGLKRVAHDDETDDNVRAKKQKM